jgi:hypothetical protein
VGVKWGIVGHRGAVTYGFIIALIDHKADGGARGSRGCALGKHNTYLSGSTTYHSAMLTLHM